MGQFHQIFDGFRIFVPNNKLNNDIVIKGYNSYSTNDRTLFTNEGLNFDNYKRVQIDPIIGYYNCYYYSTLDNGYTDDPGKMYICTRPFFTDRNDLPENTVVIADSGYKWRSDAWRDHGTTSQRPDPVSSSFTILDASFMSNYRVRTFNISKSNGDLVSQNAIEFANHVRIYIPL